MSIRESRNHKGFTVEIRPPRWKETIWLGKFETLKRARFVADAVRHYVGRPPSHYEEVFTKLPHIVCIGTVIGTPAVLSTREICASYVSAIAKGEAFELQRVDFKQKVKNVVKHLDFSFLAHSWPKLAGLDIDDSNREDAAKALEMSSPSEPMAPMSEPEFSTDIGAEPMAPMNKPEFSTDIGGISGSSLGTTSWRYQGVSMAPMSKPGFSTDIGAEPMAPMNKPEFSTDIGSILGSSLRTTSWESWRYQGVSMAPMSKPEFSTDIGGISGSSSGTTSWRYKGVSHRMNKWVAEIRVPKGNKDNMGRNIWLGAYPTPLEAAFAFDVAVMCLGGGESRQLNFHHPIYEQIPRILPDLLPWVFTSECRKVVKEFLELAKEVGNSVPMTLVGEPKDNTISGGSPRGLQGTSRECPDLCPECSKTFLASQSMLHHLMDHWRNQKLSPPPQFSPDFGGDSLVSRNG